MVQELHVLRCFSCDTFQSHIVKKTNKWECKVCGTKQSIKKVYGRGSGKDCRIHTQKLNNLRREKEDEKQFDEQTFEGNEGGLVLQIPHHNRSPQFPKLSSNEVATDQLRESKWKEFLDQDISTGEKNDSSPLSTSLPIRNFQSKFKKRERSVDNVEAHLMEDHCSKTETYDSVDDMYSHFSFSGSRKYSEQSKDLTHHDHEKSCKKNKIPKVNLNATEKDKIKSPVFKLKKSANTCSQNKVSFKWSKYLEPNEKDSVMCIQDASECRSANSSKVDECVSFLFDDNKENTAKKATNNKGEGRNHEVPDVIDTRAVGKQPDLYLKNQSLPVFEQLCELNDDDFHLDF